MTTNDVASSPKRGGHPMGGTLSLLWHGGVGLIAIASMNDYKHYEGSNMQKPTSDSQVCLKPRIPGVEAVPVEIVLDGSGTASLRIEVFK